jgi:hypothetical protein
MNKLSWFNLFKIVSKPISNLCQSQRFKRTALYISKLSFGSDRRILNLFRNQSLYLKIGNNLMSNYNYRYNDVRVFPFPFLCLLLPVPITQIQFSQSKNRQPAIYIQET